jgi:hypothetical protein
MTKLLIKHFSIESNNLNPNIPDEEKNLLTKRLNKRAQTTGTRQNELAQTINSSEEEKQNELSKIQSWLTPNPCIKEEVFFMKLISNQQIQLSKQILDQKINSLKDENAIYHI